jgi:HEAT repeat protein
MLKSKIHIILIVMLMLAGTARLSAQTVPPAADEDKLIAVIQSNDATRKEKVDACRGLALIGTKKAIAPLAELLGDEKLSHMARYALEPIHDPSVDKALRDALGKLKGKPLIGVIGSVGVRRDPQAVPLLRGILVRSEVSQGAKSMALRALGRIGTTEAAEVLKTSLDYAPPERLPDVYEGLFRCAERFAGEGNPPFADAVDIYRTLLKQDASHQVRGGALRGEILNRGREGVDLLRHQLLNEDYIMFSAACQTALEIPGVEVTKALTSVMNQLPVDKEILVIWTLGKRGDPAAVPALSAAAGTGEKSVRIAAIKAMPEIGHASAVPVLAGLLGDNDGEISKAAQEALAAIPGDEADAAVMAMLNKTDTAPRLMALNLIGRRRMYKSVPALLTVAEGPDEKVRPAALRRVGELGSPAEFSALLELLTQYQAKSDLDAAEQALSAVCARADNPSSYTSRITSKLSNASPAQESALLRVLGVIDGTEALNAVRKAAKDSNAEVSGAAIRVLSSWKTADAAPDLLALAKNSSNRSRKTAALRGYINLIRDENLSTGQKLQMCRQAAALTERNEEKKLLLGALSTIPSVEALSMAMAHIDEPAIKDEAAFAAAAIGEKIAEQKPQEVIEAIQKALKATNNANVNQRGKAVLDKARKAAGQ